MTLNFWEGHFLQIIVCYGSLVLLSRYHGVLGLYTFAIIGPTIGNLQALKATSCDFLDAPIALGTVIFSSLNVCIDSLVEYSNTKSAQKAVWMGFFAFFLTTLLLGITVQHTVPSGNDLDSQLFREMHYHLAALFTPLPGIFAASLIAYLFSQYNDILIFSFLKKRWKQSFLGVRTFISTTITGFLDTVIFSILAWIVFNPHPLSLHTVFFSYILSSYGIRLLLGLLATPLIYWAKPIHSASLSAH